MFIRKNLILPCRWRTLISPKLPRLFLEASKSKVDDKIRNGYYTVIFTGNFYTKRFEYDNVIVVEDWISEEKYQDMTVVIDHDIAKLKCIDDGCKKFFTSSRKHNCKNVLK